MSSVKSCVVGVAAVLAAWGSVGAMAQTAPTLVVDKLSQLVQTPQQPGRSGISYVQTSAQTSTLQVYTQGFLFCENAGETRTSDASFIAAHEETTPGGIHTWAFPVLTDAQEATYTAGTLSINKDVDPNNRSSLTCVSAAADGGAPAGLREEVLDNGFDSATQENYRHLINWNAPSDFDWSSPDWAQVPADPCNPTRSQPAHINENVTCAAVTGVRGSATAGATRNATLWTATDGTNFTYLFRVDARFGPQQQNSEPQFDASILNATNGSEGASVQLKISDAFDATFLQGGGAQGAGAYCVLTTLPTTLDAAVCGGNASSLNGKPLELPLTLSPPPLGINHTTFYIAITRPIVGGPPALTRPSVAVSVVTEPSVSIENGDQFVGDDIAFGFMPTSAGFPWMSGQ